MGSLRRTRIGSLDVESGGYRIEEIEEASRSDRLPDLVIAPSAALADLAAVEVSGPTADAIRNGVRFPATELDAGTEEGQPFRVLDSTGSLLAVYSRSGSRVVAEVVLS